MPLETGAVPSRTPFQMVDLAARVDAAVLETAPFDHLYLEEVFPAEGYGRLLDHLPATECYRELHHADAVQMDGTSARRKFYLFPEHLWWLPAEQRAVWRPVVRQLCSRELQQAFKRKFRRALEARFGRPIDQLAFYPAPILLRDLRGYRIGIHADSLSKAITVQFYLPRDDAQAHLGTIFHEAQSGEGAERIKRLAFRPATGYAFPVMRRESWHSVAQTSDADGERNSLMLTYYVQDRPLDWLGERLKRFGLFLVYPFRR